MKPEFPIRLIFDDGDCLVLESPEELMAQVESIDTTEGRVWARDALDRSVILRMRNGFVEVLHAIP